MAIYLKFIHFIINDSNSYCQQQKNADYLGVIQKRKYEMINYKIEPSPKFR